MNQIRKYSAGKCLGRIRRNTAENELILRKNYNYVKVCRKYSRQNFHCRILSILINDIYTQFFNNFIVCNNIVYLLSEVLHYFIFAVFCDGLNLILMEIILLLLSFAVVYLNLALLKENNGQI